MRLARDAGRHYRLAIRHSVYAPLFTQEPTTFPDASVTARFGPVWTRTVAGAARTTRVREMLNRSIRRRTATTTSKTSDSICFINKFILVSEVKDRPFPGWFAHGRLEVASAGDRRSTCGNRQAGLRRLAIRRGMRFLKWYLKFAERVNKKFGWVACERRTSTFRCAGTCRPDRLLLAGLYGILRKPLSPKSPPQLFFQLGLRDNQVGSFPKAKHLGKATG